ncbi:hypothetical protein GCM10010919_28010 [Alishewanella longhuensis]|uniref:DUF3466 family protein n=1 Tax=Alishewanella longhuensis TaxID=1091037 RepID=A0ABQ3L656_9ALTE|nr:DUF3466 family protein [Alishewanella longhuensis]GHG74501.1 hypothetical protein GCM10010919_28010 [Alishewanella longhuensis]
MKLSPISLAVLPLLTVFTANAAVYQIVELDTTNKVQSTSGVAATPQGDVVSNGNVLLDFQVDLTEIDFDSEIIKALLTEEQLADAKNGNVDSTVTGILVNFLVSNAGLFSQPVGNLRVIRQAQNGVTEQVVFRDITNTKGNNEFAYGVNNLGQIAGTASAPSFKETFTAIIVPGEDEEEPEVPVIPQPATVWVPEPGYLLGYVADGSQRTVLPPAFTALGGGMSAAQAINNNGMVAGFTSSGVSASLTETVETACNGNLQPVQFCLNAQMAARGININSLLNQIRNFQTVEIASQGYQERAAIWQLNDNGTAILNSTLGFLGEKGTGEQAPTSEDYPAPFYYSRANAINDNNIAVGHSLYTDISRKIRVFDNFGFEQQRIYAAPHATIFNGEEVTGFIDTNEWLASIATDINNQNLVVGYALKNINSLVRNRLFVYDMNSNSVKFPNGFFNSSSTEPRDLNNNGQVVGRAEVIIGGTTTRRFHAFMYDATADSFRDLNDLVGCDAPTLVEATAINDDGEILATALINRPLLGPTGEEQLATDGTVIKQQQATAVKLRPIANGQVENCNGEDATYERKSGSFSMFWLMLLGALPLLRRRKV